MDDTSKLRALNTLLTGLHKYYYFLFLDYLNQHQNLYFFFIFFFTFIPSFVLFLHS